MKKQSDLFLSVIESHKGIIYKIANSYCKAAHDRSDLIQEIILELWRSFDKYNPAFKHSTWIYRIALNVAISFYRKSSVGANKSETLSEACIDAVKTEEPTEQDPRLLLLQQFIQELAEFDKALILLYLDGKGQKETSQILGISESNVSTKILRIKDKLKQKFTSLKNQDHAG